MEAHSVHELSRVLTPIFSQYNIRKAILFGSVAKGGANGGSDIDLLVDSGLKGLRPRQRRRLALQCFTT